MWKVAGSLLFLGVGLSTVSYGQPGGAVDRGPDHEFMMAAASEGKTQVRLGQMISHAGRGDDAWLLGRRLMRDGARAGVQLVALARDAGVALPTELSDKDVLRVDELGQRSGYALDRRYMAAMIRDQEMVLAVYEKEVLLGKDPELRRWADGTLPSLRGALEMSRAVRLQMTIVQPARTR